jgi:hypothetical protein
VGVGMELFSNTLEDEDDNMDKEWLEEALL